MLNYKENKWGKSILIIFIINLLKLLLYLFIVYVLFSTFYVPTANKIFVGIANNQILLFARFAFLNFWHFNTQLGKAKSVLPADDEHTATLQIQDQIFSSKQDNSVLNLDKRKVYSNQDTMDNINQGIHGDQKVACPSMVSGMDFIRNPRLYKGMAFNLEERQGLGNLYIILLF